MDEEIRARYKAGKFSFDEFKSEIDGNACDAATKRYDRTLLILWPNIPTYSGHGLTRRRIAHTYANTTATAGHGKLVHRGDGKQCPGRIHSRFTRSRNFAAYGHLGATRTARPAYRT